MSEQHRTSRLAASALVAIVLLLLISAVAYGDWTTVDTNNNAIDVAWGEPDYEDACGDPLVPAADARNEIRRAWYRFDGTSVYFRIETCESPALTSTQMRAVGAFDCNNDGDFADPYVSGPDGDRLAVYINGSDAVWLLDGARRSVAQMPNSTFSEKIGPDIEWKIDQQYLYPACRGSTPSVGIGWVTAEVLGPSFTVIDQSKQIFALTNPIDYGDLPNPNPAANPPTCERYPSRTGCNGPRHGLAPDYAILGSVVDPDRGDLQNPMATADDTNNTGSADDEDGVVPTSAYAWTASGTGKIDVTVSNGSGYLTCWIDWDNNDSFSGVNEKVINDEVVSPGLYAFSFTAPAAVDGVYYARCRISPSTGAATTGPIYGGETEDYRWLPQTSALSISRSSPASPDAQLSWTEVSALDSYNIYRSSTPYQQADGSPYVTVVDSPLVESLLGGDVDVFFYIMTKSRTVDSNPIESVASNEVGLFEYSIVPGN